MSARRVSEIQSRPIPFVVVGAGTLLHTSGAVQHARVRNKHRHGQNQAQITQIRRKKMAVRGRVAVVVGV